MTRRRAPPGRRGFALVNALVVVAALAAVAAGLLARAEAGRARLAALAAAEQAQGYLAAAALVVADILAADAAAGPTDHPGEAWARPSPEEPIDRGTVAWVIADLQGRFNINWPADPDFGPSARAAFERLAVLRGLAPGLAARAAEALDPAAPGRDAAFRGGPGGSRPPRGPFLAVAELRLVEGMTGDDLARLAPVLAALPADSRLNVNTALPEVVAAFAPRRAPEEARRLMARLRLPLEDVETFAEEVLDPLLGADAEARLPLDRLSVGSSWFEARVEARLDGAVLARRMLFQRGASGGRPSLVLSLPEWEP